MLLTADVGNTNIKLGIFEGDELRYKLRFCTNDKMTSDEFAVELYTFFQIYRIDYRKINGSIISSVVPKVTQPLLQAIEIVTGSRSLTIGPGLKIGMDLKIDRPETLGGDIVCGCVGAYEKYGGPVIVIFMGTATVIAFVDGSCAYRGGIIAPGVGISLDALTSRGALLPAVELLAPKKAHDRRHDRPVYGGSGHGEQDRRHRRTGAADHPQLHARDRGGGEYHPPRSAQYL